MFFFRFWKPHSFESFRSWENLRSIAGMYFITADSFLYVLEPFPKDINRFSWYEVTIAPSRALISSSPAPKGEHCPHGRISVHMSATDWTQASNHQPNRWIAFENTSKTYRNGSAVKKYIPAMLRKSQQLLKLAELYDFQNLKKNTWFHRFWGY